MSLIITVGLAIVILAIAAGLMARNRSIRALVIGLGLAAIPVGLYLTGVTDLTVNGIRSLVDWFQRTAFTNAVAWGLGLAIGGIVLFVIGIFLPKGRGRAAAPQEQVAPTAGSDRLAQKKAQPSLAGKQAEQQTTPAAGRPAAQPQAKPAQQKGLDPEDAEIEALLKKRGIM